VVVCFVVARWPNLIDRTVNRELDIIYLDNAASTWPKPPGVAEATARMIAECAAGPGRGTHRMALAAGRVLLETRSRLATLFGIRNPSDIAFTANCSEALNLAIKGFVRPGDHVVTTTLEHNSVRRPLAELERKYGIRTTYVKADREGNLDLKAFEAAFLPNTTLAVCTHASNLLGSVLPVADMAAIVRRHGARLLVDAAQTAGARPIDVEAEGIDMLAFAGHKGLFGPQGTGGLYVHPDIVLEPLVHGGTGSQSENSDMPDVRPDRYEGGTPNVPGIAGLGEGIRYVIEQTPEAIRDKEYGLTAMMMDGLAGIPGVRLLGPGPGKDRAGIVSFVAEGVESAELAFLLDRQYGIAVRAGYHCTPLAHETAGTAETGAVRASVSCMNTPDDVKALIGAVGEIVTSKRRA
jgi:cysteine desulfurase family protein